MDGEDLRGGGLGKLNGNRTNIDYAGQQEYVPLAAVIASVVVGTAYDVVSA
jgi:hypothetical protein